MHPNASAGRLDRSRLPSKYQLVSHNISSAVRAKRRLDPVATDSGVSPSAKVPNAVVVAFFRKRRRECDTSMCRSIAHCQQKLTARGPTLERRVCIAGPSQREHAVDIHIEFGRGVRREEIGGA